MLLAKSFRLLIRFHAEAYAYSDHVDLLVVMVITSKSMCLDGCMLLGDLVCFWAIRVSPHPSTASSCLAHRASSLAEFGRSSQGPSRISTTDALEVGEELLPKRCRGGRNAALTEARDRSRLAKGTEPRGNLST